MRWRPVFAVFPSLVVAGLVACSGGGHGGGGFASIGGITSGSGTGSTTGTGASSSGSSTTTPGGVSVALIVSVVSPVGVQHDDVKIMYRLIDQASKPWDILVDLSTDQGKTWHMARMGKGGDGQTALASGPGPLGVEHPWVWDSVADVGATLASDVRLRITAVNGNASGATASFAIDNAALNTAIQVTRGPYLQATTKTSTIVVWKTSQPTETIVEYGDSPALGLTAGNPNAQETTHAVTIQGLKAGTRYHYRVGSKAGPVTLRESFTSAPDPTASFRFLVFGDSGTGSQEQMDLAKKMEAEQYDFVLHMGDVIYPIGASGDYDPKFFKPYKGMLKKAPIFPCIGNHDLITLGIGYKDAFYINANNPSGNKFYYSFEWGDAKFISLETTAFYHIPFGAHMTWLQNELASNTKTWLIVYMHVPLFSSGTHGDDKILQTILGPLFEQYKVSLVFEGHDHNYERTNPIKKYNNDPAFKGIPYVLSGGGGADIRGVSGRSSTAKAESAYHYLLCDVKGRNLDGTAKRLDGTTLDQFTVQAR